MEHARGGVINVMCAQSPKGRSPEIWPESASQSGTTGAFGRREYALRKKLGTLNELVVLSETQKYKTFAAAFRDAAVKLQLPQLPAAHQLRHASPSVGRTGNRRPLAEVKRRGRWAADRSVKRYETSGLVDSRTRIWA